MRAQENSLHIIEHTTLVAAFDRIRADHPAHGSVIEDRIQPAVERANVTVSRTGVPAGGRVAEKALVVYPCALRTANPSRASVSSHSARARRSWIHETSWRAESTRNLPPKSGGQCGVFRILSIDFIVDPILQYESWFRYVA